MLLIIDVDVRFFIGNPPSKSLQFEFAYVIGVKASSYIQVLFYATRLITYGALRTVFRWHH
jgi:hypothetical protein